MSENYVYYPQTAESQSLSKKIDILNGVCAFVNVPTEVVDTTPGVAAMSKRGALKNNLLLTDIGSAKVTGIMHAIYNRIKKDGIPWLSK